MPTHLPEKMEEKLNWILYARANASPSSSRRIAAYLGNSEPYKVEEGNIESMVAKIRNAKFERRGIKKTSLTSGLQLEGLMDCLVAVENQELETADLRNIKSLKPAVIEQPINTNRTCGDSPMHDGSTDMDLDNVSPSSSTDKAIIPPPIQKTIIPLKV